MSEGAVERLNESCIACRDEFKRRGIPFMTSMCKTCSVGADVHKAMLAESPKEREWGKNNWSSSEWENYYKG